MKLLHLLSQRPDSTGSGFYVQAIIREAKKSGHDSFLVAGISGKVGADIGSIPAENCSFVRFEGLDLPFPIPGMSDVMPYKSKRFNELTDDELELYERCFAKTIAHAVSRFKPDLIHSNHLWLMTAITRDLFPDILLVTSCHGTDLRQFKNCVHLRPRITEIL